MTREQREQAARVLESMRFDYIYNKNIDAIDTAIAVLREQGQGYTMTADRLPDGSKIVAQPDPITGLVPCGCGGDAVRNGRSFLCAYVTSCSECGTLAWSKASQQEADNNWNTAMGYKGADE